MQADYSYYLVNSESQPDWLFSEEREILNNYEINSENNVTEHPHLPYSNVIVIGDTFDIFGFHFKSAPDDHLKVMFYNKNGNIIIRYCSGKGRIQKIDDGEMVSLPI